MFKSNTLLLADGIENFRNMCLETYELDPACFLLPPGLAFKNSKVKLNLKMLSIIGGIFHSIYWYAKANNKYMKDYDKSKE